MKVLLLSIGSRGDVQPILALATELRGRGFAAAICAAPNFAAWVESYGVGFYPIGPDLEKWTRANPGDKPIWPTPEQMRQSAANSVIDQFHALIEAAPGYDMLLAGGMLATAAHSVADWLKIPYVFAAYCPAALPNSDVPPAKAGPPHPQGLSAEQNRVFWKENERSYNNLFGPTINEQRAALGLGPVDNASRYVTTDHPLLAADPLLGPAGTPLDLQVTQTGAWMLADATPLPQEIEDFLAAGAPPIYFGFGSMRAGAQTGAVLLEVARALGYRAIIAQGWAQIDAANAAADDWISSGNVDHARLFGRVAAVVHHGGAGTTTTAARAGTPQVIVPHNYDQYYWAQRVQTLGIGVRSVTANELNAEALVTALRECLQPGIAAQARALASRIEPQGARKAAELIAARLRS